MKSSKCIGIIIYGWRSMGFHFFERLLITNGTQHYSAIWVLCKQLRPRSPSVLVSEMEEIFADRTAENIVANSAPVINNTPFLAVQGLIAVPDGHNGWQPAANYRSGKRYNAVCVTTIYPMLISRNLT